MGAAVNGVGNTTMKRQIDMGNWGNTVDRWYHRAAIVLWPRERTFVIRAKASPRWAIGELTQLLKNGDVENARGFARRLGAFWTEVAQREESPRFFERTLAVAEGLDSPELAASILEPFTLECLTPRAAPRLAVLGQRYGHGLEWCRAILGSWASERRRATSGDRQSAWTASLGKVRGQMCAGESAQGVELARWPKRRIRGLRASVSEFRSLFRLALADQMPEKKRAGILVACDAGLRLCSSW
jgi:hypothetical protein